MEASYRPHGWYQTFWLYDRGDCFEGHTVFTRHRGGIVVGKVQLQGSDLRRILDLDHFFDMPNAKTECRDGLRFEIAVSELTRGHSVSGEGISNGNQIQTQLFQQLSGVFPELRMG